MFERHRESGRLDRSDEILASMAALEKELDALFGEDERSTEGAPQRNAAPRREKKPRTGEATENARGREIGRRIREARTARCLTQLDLSNATGIRRPNIARLERGGNTPTLETLQRLAEALGTSVSQLVSGS